MVMFHSFFVCLPYRVTIVHRFQPGRRALRPFRIPVLSNGNVRGPQDVARNLRSTGCEVHRGMIWGILGENHIFFFENHGIKMMIITIDDSDRII